MICPKCKKSIPNSATVCPYCGKKVSSSRFSGTGISFGKLFAVVIAIILITVAFTREETATIFGVSLTFTRDSIDKWCLIIAGVLSIIAVFVRPLMILHPFASVALIARFAPEFRTLAYEANIASYLNSSPFATVKTLFNVIPFSTRILLFAIVCNVIISIVYVCKIVVASAKK